MTELLKRLMGWVHKEPACHKPTLKHPPEFYQIPDVPGGVESSCLVGSAAIYGAGNDYDYVVLVEDQDVFLEEAADRGWVWCGGYAESVDNRHAVRKGDYNLIVTDSRWVYDSFVMSTEVMKNIASLVPKDRAVRVLVYTTIRDYMRRRYA